MGGEKRIARVADRRWGPDRSSAKSDHGNQSSASSVDGRKCAAERKRRVKREEGEDVTEVWSTRGRFGVGGQIRANARLGVYPCWFRSSG